MPNNEDLKEDKLNSQRCDSGQLQITSDSDPVNKFYCIAIHGKGVNESVVLSYAQAMEFANGIIKDIS